MAQEIELKIKLNILLDVPNANGHIYSKELIKKAIDEYKQLPHKIGSLEYTGATLQLDKAAFEIEEISEENDLYIATIRVLDTPEGKKLKEMIEISSENDFRLCHMAWGDIDDAGKIEEGFVISYYSIFPKSKCA